MFDLLPNELCLHIFSYIKNNDDIMKLLLLDRECNNIFTPFINDKIKTRNYLKTEDFYLLCNKKFLEANTLDFDKCKIVDNHHIEIPFVNRDQLLIFKDDFMQQEKINIILCI